MEKILLAGEWIESSAKETFQSINPRTKELLSEKYPISPWDEVLRMIQASACAFEGLRATPGERRADFLEGFARRIEENASHLVEMAHAESALPKEPRLASVELPRTTNQLRQGAAAVREGSWALPTIDTKLNIRSLHAPLGPVCVFGPNNFPFAFNSVAGGDFVAAIAAGNPVIAKANTSHPGTTRLLAELAHDAASDASLPSGTIQLLYRTSHADGAKLVSHPWIGATGYTGSRQAGLVLKQAADAAGKPIYLELSSINPVVLLPGALEERGTAIADEFQNSCLMGTGQFCTNPGLVLLIACPATDRFVEAITTRFHAAPIGTLLGPNVEESLARSIGSLRHAGARVLVGGQRGGGTGFSHANTLLATTGKAFLEHPEAFQTEAFGNESLFVIAESRDQLIAVCRALEGNLTGTIYAHQAGADDELYRAIAPVLREKVGRLINDKMPTGVAVSAGMNHGGPYPATGHPGFTAVGIPASLRRFSALHSYDNVKDDRLPPELRNRNAAGRPWRWIDGSWTREDIA
ncbi:MAG: aldehyde dehydrogenase (NADP(+)) [Planctomycetota bacterium]